MTFDFWEYTNMEDHPPQTHFGFTLANNHCSILSSHQILFSTDSCYFRLSSGPSYHPALPVKGRPYEVCSSSLCPHIRGGTRCPFQFHGHGHDYQFRQRSIICCSHRPEHLVQRQSVSWYMFLHAVPPAQGHSRRCVFR